MKTVTVIQEFYSTQHFLKCENALSEYIHSSCISLIILFKVFQRLSMMSVRSLKKQPSNKWLNLNKDVICRKTWEYYSTILRGPSRSYNPACNCLHSLFIFFAAPVTHRQWGCPPSCALTQSHLSGISTEWRRGMLPCFKKGTCLWIVWSWKHACVIFTLTDRPWKCLFFLSPSPSLFLLSPSKVTQIGIHQRSQKGQVKD